MIDSGSLPLASGSMPAPLSIHARLGNRTKLTPLAGVAAIAFNLSSHACRARLVRFGRWLEIRRSGLEADRGIEREEHSRMREGRS